MNSTTLPVFSLLPAVCQIAQSIPKTERSAFWIIIGLLGFWGWFFVIIVFIIWSTAELVGRFGSSSNDCTPLFNAAVGSLTFAVFEALIYFFFSKFFGNWIYCTIWPNLCYLLVFPSVKLFLIGIGFWDH